MEQQTSMPANWADEIAQQICSREADRCGVWLIIGAADAGKTSLAMALVRLAAKRRPVGIVDADIGQSHIGP